MSRSAAAIVLAVSLLAACHGREEAASEGEVVTAPIEATQVTHHAFVSRVAGSGTIAPLPEADTIVSPLYGGRVGKVDVRVGTSVGVGDPLLSIILDPVPAADIEKLRRVALQAQRALERQRAAFAAGVTPRISLEEAEVEAKNASDELSARTRDYEASTRRQTLRAPSAGLVTAVNVHPGQEVDPTTTAVSLVDPHRLSADIRVDGADVSRVSVGQRSMVAPIDPSAGQSAIGTVLRVAPLLEPSSQRAEVWIDCGTGLTPGTFVTAQIEVGVMDSLAVPRSALVKTDRGYRVFVIADGSAHARDVQVGSLDEALAEIRDGVSEGEQVASSGAQELADGMRVKLGEAAP